MSILEEDTSEHYIFLKVCGASDNALPIRYFKMKKHIRLRTLMRIYCEEAGFPNPDEAIFQTSAGRICEDDTPTSLQLEQGDTIYVIESPNLPLQDLI
ncbi:small ubiquitin-related modifier 3-like [Rhopalosiphum padi]|uniref:small ubiquitin-related modifier 3-like n=1 Tax=Rhopalosiphum padi TaxID=40932 RepID=UPI00298D82ED|nr:small ubiquitin-related modifier 3-like [Rhopalosiphum padi]